ncbi:MAG: NAD-dependent epimerase/dehydratase family protein [Candidatus Kapabacteria bacterium]|nr:NAD-dependent epimerase/dehydratase family protein [Candidatus Kapabacteria bacterium]
MKKILVTGALGQIGSELTVALRQKYGESNVIATDVRPNNKATLANGPFHIADVCNPGTLAEIVNKEKVDTIFHLAAILSARGEKDPQFCWNINMGGLMNILELARTNGVKEVVTPSSMAVWGPNAPQFNTPQESALKPTTMYGVTKVCGERVCDYYVQKYGLDCRGLRYPGIISSETLPGGGTTDYAVEIFYDAVKTHRYSCFLSAESTLPMMYMPDCIHATISLAEAEFKNLKHHSDFNVAAFSFNPKELAEVIKKFMPDFQIEYNPDFRQAIADSWPKSIDDSAAREEWNWKPKYDIETMTKDMLEILTKKHAAGLI